MDIKIISTDLDDTLLRSDKSISEYTLSVLNRCREKGILIAFNTARSFKASTSCIAMVKPDIIIVDGGACVTVHGKQIYRNAISAATTDGIIYDAMQMEGFRNIAVETEESNFHTGIEYKIADYQYATKYDFKEPLSQEAFKITAYFFNENKIDCLADKYPECRAVSFARAQVSRLVPKDNSKRNGIHYAAHYLGIDLSQVAAFGDDYPDVDMIAGCGYGIAVGNAADKVKDVANYICDTNDNDGVAKWIEENIL